MALRPTRSSRPENVIKQAKERDSSSILSFPNDLGAHSILMIFREYNYVRPGERGVLSLDQSTFQSARTGATTSISLPIPSNLRDNDNLRVDRFDMGYMGAEIAAQAQNVMNTNPDPNMGLGSFLNTVTGPLKDIVNTEEIYKAIRNMDTSKMSRDLAFLLRSQLSGNVGRSVDAGLGSTVNPKAALAFEGVELKNHSFNWNLAPRSFSESQTLRNIVRIIKQKSLPSYVSFARTGDKAYLKYPNTVDMFLLGVDAEHFIKFKTAMISNVTVDYTSQGNLSLVQGGRPAVVNLAIEFMEMDIHTSEDYGGTGELINEFSGGGLPEDSSGPGGVQ